MALETRQTTTLPARAPMPEVTVRALMRRHWIAVMPQSSLFEAERLMRLARLRQLPVVAEGVLVGLVDHGAVLRASLERFVDGGGLGAGAPVAAVMDANPPTAGPDDPLPLAARRMLEGGMACLPVVETRGADERRIVGLLVESDLLRRAYLRGDGAAG
jgi:CBS domain-containing protein